MARVVSWVFALAIPATVIHATKFGHEPHGLERRQGEQRSAVQTD